MNASRPSEHPQIKGGNVKTFSCLSHSAQWLPTRVDYLCISLAAKASNRRESSHTLDYLARGKEREIRTVKTVPEDNVTSFHIQLLCEKEKHILRTVLPTVSFPFSQLTITKEQLT